jgi:hypothetical protein
VGEAEVRDFNKIQRSLPVEVRESRLPRSAESAA